MFPILTVNQTIPMATTFTGMTPASSLAGTDNKFVTLYDKFSLVSSSTPFDCRNKKNAILRKSCLSQIKAVTKEIEFNDYRCATDKLLIGVNKLGNLVGVTLGPKGKYVFREDKITGEYPKIVTHGLTIAKEVELDDPVENIGVKLVLQAAAKTHDLVGGGTTTCTVLAQALFVEGVKVVASGKNPNLVVSGMKITIKAILAELKLMSKEANDRELDQEVVALSSLTKAGVKEGIVVGGGCTLLRLAARVDDIKRTLEKDEEVGADVVKKALHYPLMLIAKNSGDIGSVVCEKVLSNNNQKYGYNAATGQYDEDMMAARIIDPTKVVRCCIEQAMSVTKSLLLCEGLVVERKKSEGGRISRSLQGLNFIRRWFKAQAFNLLLKRV